MYKFASAERQELIVFGAARPKYSQKSVEQWIKFMQDKYTKLKINNSPNPSLPQSTQIIP